MSVRGENGPDAVAGGRALQQRDGDPAVLVPVCEGDLSPRAVDLARTIAVGSGSALLILQVVCLPEQTPLDINRRSNRESPGTLSHVVETAQDETPDITVRGRVRVGRNRLSILAGAADAYAIDTVVVDDSWNNRLLAPLMRTPVEKLSAAIPPPVVSSFQQQLAERVPSILVPVGGGPTAGAAIDVATALATAHDAHIELLHVVPPGESTSRARGILEEAASRLQGFEDYDTWLLEADRIEDAIVEQSQYYPVTVIGRPQKPRLRRLVYGSKSRTVRENGSNSVLTVWD